MNYVPAPDVQERLSRALDILLKAAGKHTATLGGSVNAKKEEPRQVPSEDTLTGGDEEGEFHY